LPLLLEQVRRVMLQRANGEYRCSETLSGSVGGGVVGGVGRGVE
jgi:hypothetical protein